MEIFFKGLSIGVLLETWVIGQIFLFWIIGRKIFKD